MKFLLILFLLIGSSSIAQKKAKAVLSTIKTMAFYCGMDNTVEVMIEGSPQKKFTLKAECGSIKKIDLYTYEVTPTNVGMIILTVIDDKGVELARKNIPVKSIPTPTAIVGGKIGGTMTVSQMKAQGGVSCTDYLEPQRASMRPGKIIGYSVKIIRSDSLITEHKVSGNVFSKEVRTSFGELQVGDKVAFFDIGYEYSSCVVKQILEPIEFVLE